MHKDNSASSQITLKDTIPQSSTNVDKTKFYVTTDSIKIISNTSDTLIYSKQDFNEIVDNFPTLYENFPDYPDISYGRSGYYKSIIDKNVNKKDISFSSEGGEDEFYILYAYFLKKKNIGKELAVRRNHLITIFLKINLILDILNYGGTFYGHQGSRINGYAEYAIYLYKEDSNDFNKPYDISKQKNLYINLLRQKIKDEISIDNEVPRKAEKDMRQKDLFKMVDELDKLITDNFYLTEAQQFQFLNY